MYTSTKRADQKSSFGCSFGAVSILFFTDILFVILDCTSPHENPPDKNQEWPWAIHSHQRPCPRAQPPSPCNPCDEGQSRVPTHPLKQVCVGYCMVSPWVNLGPPPLWGQKPTPMTHGGRSH